MRALRTAVACGCLVLPGLLLQDEAAPSEPRQDELADALAELRADIALEQRALAELEARTRGDLFEERRAELAGELVALRLEIAESRAAADRRADELARAERVLTRRTEEDRRARAALAEASDALSIHLREVPGAEDARRALRSEDLAPETLFEAWAEALEASRSVTVRRAELPTASGTVESDVTLLSVAQTRFAYRTPDGRVALALSSPAEASGYRWSEALAPSVAEATGEAFETLAADDSAWVFVPLDPTGLLVPEELGRDTSLAARLQGGGPLMVPLALVALAALALAGERFWTLFVRTRRGAGLARDVLRAVRDGGVEQARALCEHPAGPIGRTLGACLDRHAQGQGAMEDAIQEQLLFEAPLLRRFLRTLTVLAAIAPLIGLLGTVTGIIQTFGVIRSVGATDPGSMAGGISVALVTTATGLSIAIPILLLVGILRGRGDRILSDVERYAASLLVVLAHGDVPSRGGSRG